MTITDTTCRAFTAAGTDCQSPATTTIEGLPFCHRRSHQRQAVKLAAAETATAAPPVASPVVAAPPLQSMPSPVAPPVPKPAPKLKAAPKPPTATCSACGGVGVHRMVKFGRLNVFDCADCGAGFQLPIEA